MFYKAIKIQDSFYKSTNGETPNEITELNQINIFVGQNNSGKSRFLRGLFKGNLNFRSEQHKSIKDFFLNLKSEVKNAVSSLSHSTQKRDINDESNKIPEDFLYLSNDHKFSEILSKIEGTGTTLQLTNEVTQKNAGFKIAAVIENAKKITNFRKEYLTTPEPRIVYIPLLRGLKNPLKNDKNDHYSDRIKLDYGKSLPENCEIFTGLSLYEEVTKLRLGKKEGRDTISKFEQFLSKNFFNGKTIDIVPHTEDDVIYVKIGDGEDYPIYDLGDGIQTIIIMTFPLFKYRNEDMVLLIEEPEFGLHPGMQRILLETYIKGISDSKGKRQLFFTTHSNHFLDISLEKEIKENVSIYQFKENADTPQEKEITMASQNKDLLDLLGVRNGSVFLSNCIIWVEGVSDRIYIKKFLELLQKKKSSNYEEDKHFTILEYGGGNITHFNFEDKDFHKEKINISSISKKNFLLIDKDLPKSGSKKDKRLNVFKEKLPKENFYGEAPEIENLLDYKTYQQYLDSYSKRVTTWKIKKKIGNSETFKEKVMKKDIGDMLREFFIDTKKKEKDISILGQKKLIAERMVTFIEDFDEDLPREAKKLTEKIYSFILKNNQ